MQFYRVCVCVHLICVCRQWSKNCHKTSWKTCFFNWFALNFQSIYSRIFFVFVWSRQVKLPSEAFVTWCVPIQFQCAATPSPHKMQHLTKTSKRHIHTPFFPLASTARFHNSPSPYGKAFMGFHFFLSIKWERARLAYGALFDADQHFSALNNRTFANEATRGCRMCVKWQNCVSVCVCRSLQLLWIRLLGSMHVQFQWEKNGDDKVSQRAPAMSDSRSLPITLCAVTYHYSFHAKNSLFVELFYCPFAYAALSLHVKLEATLRLHSLLVAAIEQRRIGTRHICNWYYTRCFDFQSNGYFAF